MGAAASAGHSVVAKDLAALPSGLDSQDDAFSCPVCCDVLHEPTRGACVHVFCAACLTTWVGKAGPSPACPVCRAPLGALSRCATTQRALALAPPAVCSCGATVALSHARAHAEVCPHVAAGAAATKACREANGGHLLAPSSPSSRRVSAAGFAPAGVGPAAEALRAARARESARPAPSPRANRVTFCCPLCPAGVRGTLDAPRLAEHVREAHAREDVAPVLTRRAPAWQANRAAVCPICAAMPWGDPTYVSRCFVQHCALRHRFEYDAVVNPDEDEEETLRRVLAESAIEAGLPPPAAALPGAAAAGADDEDEEMGEE